MNKKILVVAAHPDDEVLGCGGTMARHAKNGDKVHIVFMSDGVNSRENVKYNEENERREYAKKASEILGAQTPKFFDFPDNMMDTVPLLEIVKELEVYIQELQPNIVYTHYKGDLNIDHQITYQAVMTACRPTPRSSITQIYLFEILSSTEWSIASTFSPTHFVDISDEFELKIKALKMYKEEIKDFPNSRSIESLTALSVFRGGSMGLNFAEAFSVERSLA